RGGYAKGPPGSGVAAGVYGRSAPLEVVSSSRRTRLHPPCAAMIRRALLYADRHFRTAEAREFEVPPPHVMRRYAASARSAGLASWLHAGASAHGCAVANCMQASCSARKTS